MAGPTNRTRSLSYRRSAVTGIRNCHVTAMPVLGIESVTGSRHRTAGIARFVARSVNMIRRRTPGGALALMLRSGLNPSGPRAVFAPQQVFTGEVYVPPPKRSDVRERPGYRRDRTVEYRLPRSRPGNPTAPWRAGARRAGRPLQSRVYGFPARLLLNACLSTLPGLVNGISSTKYTVFDAWKVPLRPRTNPANASGIDTRSVTKHNGRIDRVAQLLIRSTKYHGACHRRVSDQYVVDPRENTLEPLVMIVSFLRFTIKRCPRSSLRPPSPICSQPPLNVSAVNSGRFM
jgi:hypothetical protein